MHNQKPEEEKQKLPLDMKREFMDKWEKILEDVEKQKIPVQFLKKLVIKLDGKRQQTINIQKLFQQGLESDQIETAIGKRLSAMHKHL